MHKKIFVIRIVAYSLLACLLFSCSKNFEDAVTTADNTADQSSQSSPSRQKILLNDDWRFMKYGAEEQPDNLVYDVRPAVEEFKDDKDADSKPEEAVELTASKEVLKAWILPTANDFIKDPANRHARPEGNPGQDFPFVQIGFDDSAWENVNLPHDWAIAGPFLQGHDAAVGGGMGRLPSPGVAWYRKKLDIPASDIGKRIFLQVDGAMSYAMVWLNGNLVGGWPYGYASWQLDLTPYLKPGKPNQLAIRLDNPPDSSRWYPGGGLYRNVWLVKTQPVHVARWGTHIITPQITKDRATVVLELTLKSDSDTAATVSAATHFYALDESGKKLGKAVAQLEENEIALSAGETATVSANTEILNPRLWGPLPNQTPNLYLAVTELRQNDNIIDRYETRFGIRELKFDADKGVFVNGERIYMQGVNQHHDLGALGAAFNVRAAERQLEILREMGTNAIRMAHNPPARELLDLTDRMGFLVVDEIFDVWERKKTPLDFHLIFPDWHEADLRAFIRRDRNHPSVIMWSIGNEVGEQYTDEAGAALATKLHNIVKEEDSTRPTAASMNYAKPPMPFPGTMDTISLNYQGEGIRNAPAYKGLKGITTEPLYPSFHTAHPDKLIFSSENAAAVSSRGEYLFPVANEISAPVKDGEGGDPQSLQVSAYELYTAPFGSSADKVLASLEQHPYVAGGFVWSGWDYLGEPTPYYLARSSYYGVIDLAGFKKDRFYLYQAHWRPELPMAHILPHWNWAGREGETTPVHVFTSGDAAELFLNGKSLGKKQKARYQYRLRWDDVRYQSGELKVLAYKNGKVWAENSLRTTDVPAQIRFMADRPVIRADAEDLSFVTVEIQDKDGLRVPNAKTALTFSLEGPGEIVATDNGDPADMTSFKSLERKAFSGLCLVIVKGKQGQAGELVLSASANGLQKANTTIRTVHAQQDK